MQRLITLANLQDDSIVLDFFSGSASTAHALMKTNAEKKYLLQIHNGSTTGRSE